MGVHLKQVPSGDRWLATWGCHLGVALGGGVVIGLLVGTTDGGGIGVPFIAALMAAMFLFVAQAVEARRGLRRAAMVLEACRVEDDAVRHKVQGVSRDRVRSLATGVTVRLNNALMVILGSIDILETHTLNAAQRAEFKSIRSGVADANRVCCRLSQMASGTKDGPSKDHDLIGGIRQLVPTIRARAGGSVRVQLITEADELRVRATGEATMCLLQHAVNVHLATIDERDGRLSILARTSASAQYAVVDIESTGVLPLEADEPFKTAVEAIPGASVKLHCTDRGSRRSRLRLPIPAGEATSWQQNAQTGSWRMPLERDVLVVHADDTSRTSIVRVLDANGCAVRAIESANEGREVLRRFGRSIGLAIVDLCRDDGSGLAFAQWLRRTHPDIPLLMTSEAIDRAVPDDLAVDPGVVLIEQPIMQRDLEAAIERLVPLAELSAVSP